jgi:hypothetical protein
MRGVLQEQAAQAQEGAVQRQERTEIGAQEAAKLQNLGYMGDDEDGEASQACDCEEGSETDCECPEEGAVEAESGSVEESEPTAE